MRVVTFLVALILNVQERARDIYIYIEREVNDLERE